MISKKVSENVSQSSWIRKMFEEGTKLAKKYGKENVYDYSIGNPYKDPPKEVQDAFIKYVTVKGVHRYMNNAGFEDVREKIANKIDKEAHQNLTSKNIVMTSGAAGAINVVLKSILNPDEEVIVFAPYFVEYGFYVDNHGGVLKIVQTKDNKFMIDLEVLEKMISSKTKAIIINSPNNPSGVVYPKSLLEEMETLLKKKEKELGITIFVISDEPYATIVYDNVEVPNILNIFENGIIVNSFSKSLALAGERIGYICVGNNIKENQKLIDALVFSNRTLGFGNAQALAQKAVSECLDVQINNEDYLERRNYIYDNLTKMGFDIIKPEGTFYLFPKSPIEDDIEFVHKALEYNLLLVPGTGFGSSGYFRMSYCVEMDMIEKSMKAFEKLMNDINKNL